MNLRNILVVICVSLLLSSCDYIMKAYKETFQEQNDKAQNNKVLENESEIDEETVLSGIPELIEAKEINLLENAEKLDAIQQQLYDIFPGKDLKIFPPHVYFDSDRIRLQLVDPDIPENVDWYYYEAETETWEKKDPVKINLNLQRKPIQLNEVKFSTANIIFQELLERTKTIEGAEIPRSVYFSFHVKVWNWNARIYGSRADYSLKADKNGNVIEFKRV